MHIPLDFAALKGQLESLTPQHALQYTEAVRRVRESRHLGVSGESLKDRSDALKDLSATALPGAD